MLKNLNKIKNVKEYEHIFREKCQYIIPGEMSNKRKIIISLLKESSQEENLRGIMRDDFN